MPGFWQECPVPWCEVHLLTPCARFVQVDQGSQICATEPIHIIEDIAKPKRHSVVTAWVNVIYGCNECCTYCVVPGVRGKEQSREPEAIRREMLALGEAG